MTKPPPFSEKWHFRPLKVFPALRVLLLKKNKTKQTKTKTNLFTCCFLFTHVHTNTAEWPQRIVQRFLPAYLIYRLSFLKLLTFCYILLHLFTYLFIHLFICLFFCLFVYLFIFPPSGHLGKPWLPHCSKPLTNQWTCNASYWYRGLWSRSFLKRFPLYRFNWGILLTMLNFVL